MGSKGYVVGDDSDRDLRVRSSDIWRQMDGTPVIRRCGENWVVVLHNGEARVGSVDESCSPAEDYHRVLTRVRKMYPMPRDQKKDAIVLLTVLATIGVMLGSLVISNPRYEREPLLRAALASGNVIAIMALNALLHPMVLIYRTCSPGR